LSNKLNISIIIPVYNTEQFLKPCINSILSQGLGLYEIIIINDGSTDKSLEIIKKYKLLYPSIVKYINQTNAGQGAARNKGINAARGEFIYFMDSDDILKKNSLNNLYRKCNKNDLDAIFFDGESFIDKQISNDNQYNFDYQRNKDYGFYNTGKGLFTDLTKDNKFFVSPCLYIVKRNILINNNIYFPEGIKNEDEYFTTNLMLYIGRCLHTNNKLFLRRIRSNSTMTSTNKTNNFIGLVSILQKFDQTYEEIKFESEKVQKAYLRKMEQIFRSGMLVYNTYLKQDRSLNNNLLLSIAKKHKYFSTSTKIFMIVSNNYKLYSLLKFLKDSLYRVRRLT